MLTTAPGGVSETFQPQKRTEAVWPMCYGRPKVYTHSVRWVMRLVLHSRRVHVNVTFINSLAVFLCLYRYCCVATFNTLPRQRYGLFKIDIATMPGRIADKPKKRVLTDTTNTHNVVKSPPSAKKRNLNSNGPNVSFHSSQTGASGFKSKLGSSQPKSHFETEVLEKMTQDITGLKHTNSEKDQQWDRPSLDDFNADTDTLTFQQIEIEEGTLLGGKMTLKMFGVSEVSRPSFLSAQANDADRTFHPPPCH